jgi:hypothetical protein
MKQQTAVEWLLQRFEDGDMYNVEDAQFIKHQALAMEKEQMEDTWIAAHQAGRFEGKGIAEEDWQTFTQYYIENYGK